MYLIEMRMEIVNVNGEADTNVGEHLKSGFHSHFLNGASEHFRDFQMKKISLYSVSTCME